MQATEIFICSKIAAKSFGDGSQAIHMDKELIWDQLLTSKAEIIQS